MLTEFLYHLFTLDVGWIINDVILPHLFWVFVFVAATVFIFEPKKQFWGFIFFVFLVWAIVDVSVYAGWSLMHLGPLSFVFMTLVAFVFLEKDGKISKWNISYSIFALVAIMAFVTFFL